MKLPQFVCLKCGHVWIPRKEGRPVLCPKCKNPKWDKEKKVRV